MNHLRSLLRADFMVLLKNKRAIIVSVVVPIYILIILNLKGKTQLGSPIFLVVVAITIGLLSTCIMGYALTIARDRERGVFQRLRVTPAPAWAIMISRLLVQVLANLFIALVVLLIGSTIYHLSLDAAQYAATILVAILGAAVFLSMAQMLVGLLKSTSTVNSVGILLYVTLLASGLFGPSGALGEVFQNMSKWTPVGTLITVFLSALQQTPWGLQAWVSLLGCFGYIIVCSVIGIKWFQWEAN